MPAFADMCRQVVLPINDGWMDGLVILMMVAVRLMMAMKNDVDGDDTNVMVTRGVAISRLHNEDGGGRCRGW